MKTKIGPWKIVLQDGRPAIERSTGDTSADYEVMHFKTAEERINACEGIENPAGLRVAIEELKKIRDGRGDGWYVGNEHMLRIRARDALTALGVKP